MKNFSIYSFISGFIVAIVCCLLIVVFTSCDNANAQTLSSQTVEFASVEQLDSLIMAADHCDTVPLFDSLDTMYLVWVANFREADIETTKITCRRVEFVITERWFEIVKTKTICTDDTLVYSDDGMWIWRSKRIYPEIKCDTIPGEAIIYTREER